MLMIYIELNFLQFFQVALKYNSKQQRQEGKEKIYINVTNCKYNIYIIDTNDMN